MARESLCGQLKNGQNSDCADIKRKYFQQAVLFNKNDVDADSVTITRPNQETGECNYNVQFSLKEGKTGYFFQGPGNGSSFFGSYDKTRSDLGIVQYNHHLNMLIVGADEESKCILEALDKGLLAGALQFTDGTVEIYGFENGISTDDYTYDPQGGGGGSAIVLSSGDNSPERYLPLIYKSAVSGGETADFDAAFANISS